MASTIGHAFLGRPLHEALTAEPIPLPYLPEPQGEAICWKADGGGYYTVSEEHDDIPAHLYFYPRLRIGSATAPTQKAD